ncbi:MAG: phosphoribosylformylglycinamidine synthase subunit PurQ [Coriobacteriales bacterium]|jgi:phosphoribosylformylglycinamidine synthase|nr:phosphoribosylformylglycinamidine synthase subunit PurQ [Coriobacteriales bacterium]
MATRYGILRFPGSNCEQDVMGALQALGRKADYVWHGELDISRFDALILPGGFSYGDYLRCGAIAAFAPVMQAVKEFADRGGYVMGICNGFQILTEAHLLPGALIANRALKFICEDVRLRLDSNRCAWLSDEVGSLYTIPINHNEGNFICDPHTLADLQEHDQIVLRYLDSAPNGALDDIAGICNRAGNVFGLMPHPERVSEGLGGNADGAAFFRL